MPRKSGYEVRGGRSITRDDKSFIRIDRAMPSFMADLPASPAEVDYLTREICAFLNAHRERLERGYRAYLASESAK